MKIKQKKMKIKQKKMKIKQDKKKRALSGQTAEFNTKKHENSKTTEYGANIQTKKIMELGEKKEK